MQDRHGQLVSNAIETGTSPQVVQSLHERLVPSSNRSVVSRLDYMDKLLSTATIGGYRDPLPIRYPDSLAIRGDAPRRSSGD